MKWLEVESPMPGCRAFKKPGLALMVGIEGGKWHMSLSHVQRYPTWDEIRDARYEFIPDAVTMAMILPPKSEYVNVHPNCFHLWEVL